MKKTECFKIQLLQFDSASDIFDLSQGLPILRIGCGGPIYSPNPVHIEADPFLFVKDDILYLFYEHKLQRNKGVLNMLFTKDLKKWSKPVTVLEEPYHLSFPWVFEEDGHVYMIPETGADNCIRLYEATNFELTDFKFVKELLHTPSDVSVSMGYGDSCIYKKNGKYYLLTQLQYEDHINTLELYVSDGLMCEFHPHPCSPIQHNQKTGRNAGSLMEYNGKLLRFSQDCTNRYGDNVHISQITRITPSDYEEKLIKENIIPTEIPFYREGGHQLNVVQFKGKWSVATDAQEYNRLLFSRIIYKILKFFR